MSHLISKLSIVLSFVLFFSISNSFSRDLNKLIVGKESRAATPARTSGSEIQQMRWPSFYGAHNTGEIRAVFDCFGNFGKNFSNAPMMDTTLVYSFATPVETPVEYLFGGSIWVGGIVDGDTLVSVGFDGWQSNSEMFPSSFPNNGTVIPIKYCADYSLRAEFYDTVSGPNGIYDELDPLGHVPINLKISIRSHAWHSSPQNGTIIYDMVITNVGDDMIEDGVVGLYFDADVGSASGSYLEDLAGSIRALGIGYVIDNDGDFDTAPYPALKVFAAKFLANSFNAADTNFSWWISNGIPIFDFGPRLRPTISDPYWDFGTGGTGTPEGDKNKYYIMSHKEWDYDEIFLNQIGENDSLWFPPTFPCLDCNSDVKFVLSIGHFSLEPDSSIRILFATLTGDSVHTDPENIFNLPGSPALFLSNLNFNDLNSNADISDSLAEVLLNPFLPALGLEAVKNEIGEPELQWDPWVYDEVNGYEILLEEADLATLPHPGAIPPWWKPSNNAESIIVGRTHKAGINFIDSTKSYLAQVRHLTNEESGDFGEPINFKFASQWPAPKVPLSFTALLQGQPAKLVWNSIDGISPAHYVIYKFSDSILAKKAYHPFYDDGYQKQFIQPKDSIEIDGHSYYYYSLEPYAEVDGDDSVFYDFNFTEGESYVVAGADSYGFESKFSSPVTAIFGVVPKKDILVITNSPVVTPLNYVYKDSILSFYNSLLLPFSFDFYDLRDTLAKTGCGGNLATCANWRDFIPYKLVIFDDHLSPSSFYTQNFNTSMIQIFAKILANNCKLAMFGTTTVSSPSYLVADSLPYSSVSNSFRQIFGATGSFTPGIGYYDQFSSPPFEDSLFGFIKAQEIDGTLPSVYLEVARNSFMPRLMQYWPMTTPPMVSTFLIEDGIDVTHEFHSLTDSTSVQEHGLIGLRKNWPLLDTKSYLFGFHLWYMEQQDASELIGAILFDSSFTMGGKSLITPNYFENESADSTLNCMVQIYVGDIESNRVVTDLDTGSILLNHAVSPSSLVLVSSFPGFSGQVLRLEFARSDFLNSLEDISADSVLTSCTISGLFNDSKSFRTRTFFIVTGFTLADFDGSEKVTIIDLTFLINYLYRNGPAPEPMWIADINRDKVIDMQDVVRVVDFIFKGLPL